MNLKNGDQKATKVFTEQKKYAIKQEQGVPMKEEKYYKEIEHLIKKNEINKRVRKLEENQELVTTYWQIGKIIVEAQGGKAKAKYGNELIKKWSIKLTKAYGKGYDYTNLSRFRKFYLTFPILGHSVPTFLVLLSIFNFNQRQK